MEQPEDLKKEAEFAEELTRCDCQEPAMNFGCYPLNELAAMGAFALMIAEMVEDTICDGSRIEAQKRSPDSAASDVYQKLGFWKQQINH